MIYNGRAKISSYNNSYKIEVPSKKNWFALIFGTLWLGGWLFGLIMVSTSMLKIDGTGFQAFTLLWLTMWLLGGIAIISLLLWGYFGLETLEFTKTELLFSKTVFGIGLKKKLQIEEVKKFRYSEVNESIFGGNRWAFWGLGPGKLKFNYGLKTYSLGLGLDEAEVEYLVDEIGKNVIFRPN